jgi:para-aminobenzoate N-oxygenase AurF
MSAPADLQAAARALSRASRRRYRNPYGAVEWPEAIEPDAWCFSPELLSLHGTAEYEALGEPERQRLSFLEAVNFFSLNVHGERALMEGLARRLYTRDHLETSDYLHHFLDEENKHMVLFGEFCLRYAGKVYPDRHLAVPREYEPGEKDFLFFAQVMVFEEIVDHYNARMARDGRLHPLVRRINLLHHLDESRHLAFGRKRVKDLWDRHAPRWRPETRAAAAEHLRGYLQATWSEYFSADVYRDAGLANPAGLRAAARAGEAAAERHRRATERCRRFLTRAGILPEAS